MRIASFPMEHPAPTLAENATAGQFVVSGHEPVPPGATEPHLLVLPAKMRGLRPRDLGHPAGYNKAARIIGFLVETGGSNVVGFPLVRARRSKITFNETTGHYDRVLPKKQNRRDVVMRFPGSDGDTV